MEHATLIQRLQEAEGFLFLPLSKGSSSGKEDYTLHLVKQGMVRNLHFSEEDFKELQGLQEKGKLLGFQIKNDGKFVLRVDKDLSEDETLKDLLNINPFANFSVNKDVFNSFKLFMTTSEKDIPVPEKKVHKPKV